MVLLSQEELRQKRSTVRVGQIWKCLEDNRIILISLDKDNEIRGHLFTGFEVVPYISLAPMDFARYFDLILDPRVKKVK